MKMEVKVDKINLKFVLSNNGLEAVLEYSVFNRPQVAARTNVEGIDDINQVIRICTNKSACLTNNNKRFAAFKSFIVKDLKGDVSMIKVLDGFQHEAKINLSFFGDGNGNIPVGIDPKDNGYYTVNTLPDISNMKVGSGK